jgi:hypothetical protein
MNLDLEIDLQGRIVALEILVRGYLFNVVSESADPVQAVADLRQMMTMGFQTVGRPIDEYSDAVMEAAGKAINSQCDEVLKRIEYHKSKGLL